jgi:hypothetical protein
MGDWPGLLQRLVDLLQRAGPVADGIEADLHADEPKHVHLRAHTHGRPAPGQSRKPAGKGCRQSDPRSLACLWGSRCSVCLPVLETGNPLPTQDEGEEARAIARGRLGGGGSARRTDDPANAGGGLNDTLRTSSDAAICPVSATPDSPSSDVAARPTACPADPAASSRRLMACPADPAASPSPATASPSMLAARPTSPAVDPP